MDSTDFLNYVIGKKVSENISFPIIFVKVVLNLLVREVIIRDMLDKRNRVESFIPPKESIVTIPNHLD